MPRRLCSPSESRTLAPLAVVFSIAANFVHCFPPSFPAFFFLGLPFGHPPLNDFLALLALLKCSGPCRARVRLPPFLPMALAAAERGLGLRGFIAAFSIQHTIAVFVHLVSSNGFAAAKA